MLNRDELNKRAWYRFCKLCYGFAYVVCLGVALVFGYSDFPTEYVDNDRSVIRCTSGEEFSAGLNSIYPIAGKLDSRDDEKARKLCASPYVFDYVLLPNNQTYKIKIPTWKDPKAEVLRLYDLIQKGTIRDTFDLAFQEWEYSNYTFMPVKAVRGGYATLLWGLGIVAFVGELIRRSFLYVVAGVPFVQR